MNKKELMLLQKLPLNIKVAKSKLRIEEFVRHYGVDGVYISFSGGKDSTVLLDIVRSLYPEIPAVFSDTGLEFPELKEFVRTKDNVVIVRPKMSFKQVVTKYGYPIISKKVSRALKDLKNPSEKNQNIRNLYLTGITSKGTKCPSRKLASKYLPLVNAQFKISNSCCDVMKKQPLHKYEKKTNRKPIIGTQAWESRDRENAYMKSGCINWNKESCNPLGFWTEQDILSYIVEKELEYASVYGEIQKCIDLDGTTTYRTTGEKRTGCIFCMFGCTYERGKERRFIRLGKTHPKLYDYCINGGEFDSDGLWAPNNKGLGLGYVLDSIGVEYIDLKGQIKGQIDMFGETMGNF